MTEEEEASREAALSQLAELGQEMERSRKLYEHDNDTWWNGLTEKEREDAFYAVCKRIHEGDVKLQGSYRYVLYDIFGFDMGMYGAGMDCGYMSIHNLLHDGLEFENFQSAKKIKISVDDFDIYQQEIADSQSVRCSIDDGVAHIKIRTQNYVK